MKEEVRQIKKCFHGRTETNKVVVFEGTDELINKIIDVKIIQDCLWYLKGEIGTFGDGSKKFKKIMKISR